MHTPNRSLIDDGLDLRIGILSAIGPSSPYGVSWRMVHVRVVAGGHGSRGKSWGWNLLDKKPCEKITFYLKEFQRRYLDHVKPIYMFSLNCKTYLLLLFIFFINVLHKIRSFLNDLIDHQRTDL